MKHIADVLVRGCYYVIGRKAFHKHNTKAALMGSWFSSNKSSAPVSGNVEGVLKENEKPASLTDNDWKERLSHEEYDVCRKKGTEPAFTGAYYNNKDKGVYHCTCCGVELFRSDQKYDSGSGWPSFYQASGAQGRDETDSNIKQRRDESYGMSRTEVMCKECNSHLGHVFDDGPRPTGLRYCVNSTSLKFKPQSQV